MYTMTIFCHNHKKNRLYLLTYSTEQYKSFYKTLKVPLYRLNRLVRL